METRKRGPGRPRKTEPFDGPVVLTLNKKRERLEIELTAPTRRELDEYLTWVEECEPEQDPAELSFTTFEYAITTLLRTDKKWRARQRQGKGDKANKDEAPPSPGDIVKQPESVEINAGASPQSTTPGSDARKPAAPAVSASGQAAPASPSLPLPGSRDQKKAG